LSFFLPFSSVISWKSRLRCLKSRTSFPRGPSTSITFAWTLMLTPSGMFIVSDERMVFIVAASRLPSLAQTLTQNPSYFFSPSFVFFILFHLTENSNWARPKTNNFRRTHIIIFGVNICNYPFYHYSF